MKTLIIIFLVMCTQRTGYAQDPLTIGGCYARAESHYPLIRQKEIMTLSKSYSLENAAKGYLPQVVVGGQASYQSDVTQIPVEMPGVEPLSKDQYKIFGEVSQSLYHGGVVKQQKRIEEMNGVVEEGKLAVELYQLRNRINELFFGIMLLQEQIVQTELAKQDIESGLKKTEAAIANGIALQSAADVLRAEILGIQQRLIELNSAVTSYKEILGVFINQPADDIVLQKQEMTIVPDINRPELRLYDLQQESLELSRHLLVARRQPRLELFGQVGYGRPGLNMLQNNFDFYYIGGIRFNWSLSGFYTFGKEKQLLALKQRSLDVQKETFLFNTGLSLRQHESEIIKLEQMIRVDKEIIDLRTKVKQTASAQLEQGAISSHDYIREVNSEDQAKQNLVLHQTQLLLATARYQFTSGN
jgi:outer membrane protein TolC